MVIEPPIELALKVIKGSRILTLSSNVENGDWDWLAEVWEISKCLKPHLFSSTFPLTRLWCSHLSWPITSSTRLHIRRKRVYDLHDKQVLLIHTTQQDLSHHKPYHHLLIPRPTSNTHWTSSSLSDNYKIRPFSIINETATSTYTYIYEWRSGIGPGPLSTFFKSICW